MEEEELREEVMGKGKEIENIETNGLSKLQLRHINHELGRTGVSREFRLQCLRDLDDAEMPVFDFLATMLDGSWKDYGETREEVEAAEELVREWSRYYLEARDVEEFMRKLGYEKDNVREQLVEEGFSIGAAEVARIIEENGGKITREELEREVLERPRLDQDVLEEVLEKLRAEGKLSMELELEV